MLKKIIQFIILIIDISLSFLPFYKTIEMTESIGYNGGEIISYSNLFSELEINKIAIIFPLLFILQLFYINGKRKGISLIATIILFILFSIIIINNHPYYIGIAPYLFLIEQILVFMFLKKLNNSIKKE